MSWLRFLKGFPQYFPANAMEVPQIRQRPHPSTSLPVNYSRIILFKTILVSATHIIKWLINLPHISAELFLSFFMLAHEGCVVQFQILATLPEGPVPTVQKYGLDMKQFWETQSAPWIGPRSPGCSACNLAITLTELSPTLSKSLTNKQMGHIWATIHVPHCSILPSGACLWQDTNIHKC